MTTLFAACICLDYIDSPPLRQHVQRALNRGENYHQLRRAVSYANFGKLRFKTEYEQQLWGECSRLLTNCIIYYNATILSKLTAHKEHPGDAQGEPCSPGSRPSRGNISISMAGTNSAQRPQAINLEEIIQELAQVPVPSDLAESS